ncbi:hypothetical protein RchiOBHm_Chr1g0356611 [Rosa chinensis]|uniref:Uncharacterized protein n=1 Tax=Rosa chinensis TaxID=74649 RepID=A0A2P6SHM2_ROSCH|nr:hypothetical protein RchiOBHm_Chr1g0356611 [Rosa chinensis]
MQDLRVFEEPKQKRSNHRRRFDLLLLKASSCGTKSINKLQILCWFFVNGGRQAQKNERKKSLLSGSWYNDPWPR